MNDVRKYANYHEYMKAKRHEAHLINWLVEKVIPVVAIMAIVGLIFLAFGWSNLYDHHVFKTPESGKVVLISDDSTIFVPKGAYIIGEAHLYSSNDDVVFDNILPENSALKTEELVRTCGQVVVYWSLDQKQIAQNMLDS